MRYLLDTCVVSELVARQPDSGVVRWVDSTDEEKLYLSVITIGEVRKGIEKLPDSRRKGQLVAWLQDDLLTRFQGRILPIDLGVMLLWSELTAELEQRGRTMPAIDSLIAAGALQGGLQLVTRNEGDFEHTDVQVTNPWAQ